MELFTVDVEYSCAVIVWTGKTYECLTNERVLYKYIEQLFADQD